MITVGYIGFGVSVKFYHLPYVTDKENVRVKMICRSERSKDEELEKKYEGIIFTTSPEDILKDEEINLVVVATPNQFHVQYGKEALNAGKNVLIEKPIAPTAEEAQELYDLAREKGLQVFTNMNRRYDGDFQTLKEVIESGVLGEIVEIESKYDYWHPTATPRIPYFYNMGIHFIDQMLHLFGEPKKLMPYVHSYNQIEWGCDFFDIRMLYDNMRVSVTTSLFVKAECPRYIVHGKKGSFIKYGSYHVDKVNTPLPAVAQRQVEPEDKWGTLTYEDEYGNTICCKVPTKPTDYGKVYDDIDRAIQGDVLACQDEQVILADLRILDECAACAD